MGDGRQTRVPQGVKEVCEDRAAPEPPQQAQKRRLLGTPAAGLEINNAAYPALRLPNAREICGGCGPRCVLGYFSSVPQRGTGLATRNLFANMCRESLDARMSTKPDNFKARSRLFEADLVAAHHGVLAELHVVLQRKVEAIVSSAAFLAG